MSKRIDQLEIAYAEFNQNYTVTREDIMKVLDAEEDETPEALRALAMLDTLDAVLDELVKALKFLDTKTESNN